MGDVLDRSKPFFQATGHPLVRYEQDGKQFDEAGNEVTLEQVAAKVEQDATVQQRDLAYVLNEKDEVIGKLRDQLAITQSDLQEKEQQLVDLQGTAGAGTTEIARLNEQIEEEYQRAEALQGQLNEAQALIAQLEQRITEADEQVRNLQIRLNDAGFPAPGPDGEGARAVDEPKADEQMQLTGAGEPPAKTGKGK